MADPLSVTASIVGIVGPALHVVRLLAGDLKQIKDAPESIATLRQRIGEVERALVTLEKIPDQDLEALGVAEDTKATITKCGESCKQFSTELKRWTRHSTGDSLTLLDRSKIGFWKQHHIKSMEKELQYCQGAITQVVSIATLYVQTRHSYIGNSADMNMCLTGLASAPLKTLISRSLSEMRKSATYQLPLK